MVRLKALQGLAAIVFRHRFQFQDGTIKSKIFALSLQYKTRFNSKMVRLKDNGAERAVFFSKFQFQDGTIKSETPP